MSFDSSFLNNLKIGTKFRLVALGFSVPIIFLFVLLLHSKNESIDFIHKEIEGTETVSILKNLMKGFLNYEGNYLSETSELVNINDSINSLFGKLQNRVVPASKLSPLRNKWNEINSAEKPKSIDIQKWNDLLEEYSVLLVYTANSSNLILDHDLPTYYMMDAAILRLPEYLELLNLNLRLNPHSDSVQALTKGMLASGISEIKNDLRYAFTGNPPDELNNLVIKNESLLSKIPAGFNSASPQYADEMNSAGFRLWELSLKHLNLLLQKRIETLQQEMIFTFAGIGLLLGFTIILFLTISRSIVKSVEQLNEAANKVSLGDFNVDTQIRSGDELGNLSRNFNIMVKELEKFFAERNERLSIAENALSKEIADHIHSEEERTKQELLFSEVLSISVDGMRLTDEEGKIILVNEAYCRIVDIPHEKLQKKLFSEVYHPDQRESVLALYKRDLHNNSIKTHFEREDTLWTGKKIWFEFSNSFLKPSNSGVLVLSVIRDISERKNAELELMRRTQQLRNLASRLQNIREEERTMIAREIHDELGQVLTVLKIQVSLLANKLREDQTTLKSKIESVLKVIDLSVESVQKISAKLRPGILDDLGLVAAIEWQAQNFQEMTGIECACKLPDEDIELNEARSTAIFRIFQEAITNVARHANAKKTEVNFFIDKNYLILEVKDNGKGITGKEIGGSKSLGILGMKERALILGGEVFITGAPGKGTKVRVVMPVNHT